MTEPDFNIDQYIDQYIQNIRLMQALTDEQIRQVLLLKIETYPEYFEIIAEVGSKIDNKKLLKNLFDKPVVPIVTPQPDLTTQAKIGARKVA